MRTITIPRTNIWEMDAGYFGHILDPNVSDLILRHAFSYLLMTLLQTSLVDMWLLDCSGIKTDSSTGESNNIPARIHHHQTQI